MNGELYSDARGEKNGDASLIKTGSAKKNHGMALRVILTLAIMVFTVSCHAADITSSDLDDLRKQIAALRDENKNIKSAFDELNQKTAPIANSVDKAIDSKYGPNSEVTTKVGKLELSGLLQIWYYSVQHDHSGLFQDNRLNNIQDSNDGVNNDGFRIRRAQLRFGMELNENIFAEVMIDPAREAVSLPQMPDNQANSIIFKRATNTNIANVQAGTGTAGRLLQDVYINYRNFVPHHDFTIGQFKPPLGEEGYRGNSELDFIERSFIGQLEDNRDQGAMAHGEWWEDKCKDGDGRLQYWVGAFNGPGNYYLSSGQFQNRSDDNSAKDFLGRLLVRPLWQHEKWGSLELGAATEFGEHGGTASPDPIDTPTNGLNRRKTFAKRDGAWGYYAPGGALRGWWTRAEYEWQYDRNTPQTVIDLLGNGNSGDGTTQTNGKPFGSHGFFVSTGYKFSESALTERLPDWARKFEVVFRYDTYQNVEIADPIRNDHTDVFATSVYQSGINYYIQGKNAKIQLNYNVVENPSADSTAVHFHNVKNNNFMINFQVRY